MATTVVHILFRPKYGPDWGCAFRLAGIILDPNNTDVQAVLTAINAVTASVAIQISLSTQHENAGSVTSGVDYVNEDKALFVMEDADGEAHNFRIPGLLPGILTTGTERIDFTTGDPGDWVTTMTTNALGAGGAALTSCARAYRVENRNLLKSGVFIGN